MATIMPEGEAIRRAVKWISDHLQDDPNKSVQQLVNEAVMRFDPLRRMGSSSQTSFARAKRAPLHSSLRSAIIVSAFSGLDRCPRFSGELPSNSV